MVDIDFFINAVDALDTAFNNRFLCKLFLCQTLPDAVLDGFNECFPFVLLDFHDVFNFRICIGIQIVKRQVFQLILYSANAETMGNGRINIHGFQRNPALLLRRKIFQRPHVVNPVCQLNDHNPNVVGHGEENFSHIIGLLLLLIEQRNAV